MAQKGNPYFYPVLGKIMNTKSQQLKQALSVVALAAYVMLAVFGLFFMTMHMSHDGMSMENCPYMTGGHSVCPMDALSHITAWEDMVRTIVPAILIIIGIVASCVSLSKEIELSPLRFSRYRPKRPRSPYMELFSNGILNPKIP